MDKLGIQPDLLLTQTINFLIVLFVLTKFLYKPILKALKERREKIEAGLAFAEKAKVEEEKLVVKKQEIFKDTRAEVKVILENARKDGEKLRDELVEKGKKEVAQLKTKMEKELAAQLEEDRAQLAAHTVDIASAMVKKLLGTVLDEKQQHQLIRTQLTKLAKTHEK